MPSKHPRPRRKSPKVIVRRAHPRPVVVVRPAPPIVVRPRRRPPRTTVVCNIM